jgi:ankyrin repeat protein
MMNPIDLRHTTEEMVLITNQVKLMKNFLQIKLLTTQVGDVQTKTTMPTVTNTKTLPPGFGVDQQNEYDTNAGPRLLMAARDGDTSSVQTLLFASVMQFYINYTDKDGRTPLFTTASKGHAPIVKKLIPAGPNVNRAKTTDGPAPILIAAQRGHAPVVEQLPPVATSILR